MATKTIKVSDLTGEEITSDEELAELTVVMHPSIDESVELDVRPEEVEGIFPDPDTFVHVQYRSPSGDAAPYHFGFTMTVEEFNSFFEGLDMETILQNARRSSEEDEPRRGRRGRRQRGERPPRVDYSSPEHAGEPHKGRIRDAEKEHVQNNLDKVNARLERDGLRTIDPNDPVMAERYGLTGQN